ncbi:amino acid adenylation domain-containing protein [Microcoleus sp. F10-C6]|uniref:amino acid adenylation domain-containing protein n=1 Tax=unclassified Microcoleus TaxID=2642155 RepID=UPI002FD20D80
MKWNSTQTEYAQTCIHQLVEAIVELSPDGVAVVFGQESLTYRQLNSRANVLAHYLQALGVGPEVLVGICIERSLEMVVGLLGILKAGGAYVPLDPAYPTERLTFMLEDTQISVLLTQARLVESLPKHQAHVVCLDTQWQEIAFHSEENPIIAVTPDNLAYVIYTSGSTGRPKGVAMSHRPLSNLIIWQRENSTLPVGARTLQFAPVNFDVSFQEIFSTWCSGGTLVLISDQVRVDAFELLRFLAAQEINRLFLPFVALQQLAEVADAQGAVVPTLREIITAGEQLQITRPIANWLTKLQNCTLHNQYGPSESHVVTAFTLTGSPSDWPALPPIGRPIANTQIYLLDAQMQQVPEGIPGELYIGGIALARGYLNRPDLTTERFIPDPNSSLLQARLYKTGDLARYNRDGNIEFLGRSDDQVKIRGFRIELGEIEVVVTAYPAVRQAVVLAREDAPGDKRLVAYIVPTSQESPPQEQSQEAQLQAEQMLPQSNSLEKLVPPLRSYLKARLPEYMVPSAFVVLEAFPVTPSGKVDRRALPAPLPTRTTVETFVPPRTPVEEIVANIWTKILQVQPIGIHDNFFELGGNSIKAMRLINELQAQAQISQILHPTALFEAPTIAQFVAYLNEHYPEFAGKASSSKLSSTTWSNQKIEVAQIDRMRRYLHRHLSGLSLSQEPQTKKNKPAIFILSPPRSGSTLLRVIVGGHPQLFAPPELHLLSFNTLEERKATFVERIQFMGEGLIRALMEIKGYSLQEAQSLMQELEDKKLTTKQFYDLMQQWLPGKTLVDKSPPYAFNPEVLQRAEIYFENPLYVHLLRHPYGTIRSMEEAKLDLLLSAQVKDEISLSAKEKAELMWLISHQNILEFLEHIPAHRQYRVKFEDLVKQPHTTVEGLCQFLGLSFAPEMLQIYEDKKQRMTDGIHSVSRMIGDIKFHTHKEISAQAAELWKQDYQVDFLGEQTWQLAESFGYERITSFDDQEEGEI